MKFKKKNKNKNPFAVQINPDPKKSAEFFNMAMNTGDAPTSAMAEDLNDEDLEFYGDENIYFYSGKVYARENDEYVATIMKKVNANSKEEAIKKIIRFFKVEHIESLLKYFKGYKTNLYIDEDKVERLGFTKEFERYLDFVASKQKEVETKVDDPKYNFDEYDREDDYIVEENQGDLKMEFEKISLYLFPELTNEDLQMVKAYGLNFIGKNYGPDDDEENWVVTGQESQLKRFAQNWLGYELHPDYFYKDEADFAGEVEEAVTEAYVDAANDDDNDDIQTYFYDDEAWGDSSVSARKDFDAEGKEFTWVIRHGDVEHLDFDNWAVWEAYCHDDAETYYFIVDEDTGFIDWGPVDTLEEAQEFLASKVSDWGDMDESCESDKEFSEKLTESVLEVNQGDLVDFGPYGKLYVCNTNYYDDYYWVTDEEELRMDKYAPGWSIEKDLAKRVIESAFDDEDYELDESYELLNGNKVEVYSDYNVAKARANELGLKKAEYGDIYNSDYAYCYWNESGDRNDDEQIIAYYKFENGKPRPLTSKEEDIIKRKYEIDYFDNSSMKNESKTINEALWDSSRVIDLVSYYLTEFDNMPIDQLQKKIWITMKEEGSTLPDVETFKKTVIETVDRFNDELDELDESKSIKEAWEPEFKEEDWEQEDIDLWKSIDWKARNYMDYPVPEDSFEYDAIAYGFPGGRQVKKVKFIKYLRSNPIFPPYYAPEEKAFKHTVGSMYDGHKKGKYGIHNRYETQEVYDMLSEDTIKTKSGKWVNKGDSGETHGEFKTKKAADAQRRAIWANGFKG